MKLLFIVTSFWAYGELQIAMDFASGMVESGHKVKFLIPPSHTKKVQGRGFSYQVLIPSAGTLNRILFQNIENTFQPTHIILSDFLNYAFCERHYGVTEEDLKIFSGLAGAFDLYDFTLAGKHIDTYGFRAREMTRLRIEKYDFLLQPCPVNHPDSENFKKNRFRYRMFQEISSRGAEDKKKARELFYINSDEKVILMTGAVWQSSFRPYARVKQMVTAVDSMIMKIVESLPENYKVYWIGSRYSPFPVQEKRIKYLDSLAPEKFEILVDTADVFLSMNYISTSMVRAALRGVPVVLLGNSFVKKEGNLRSLTKRKENDIVNKLEEIYPFRMFPVGWYSFLESVVQKNSFYQLTKCVEIFEEEETVSAITNAASMSLEQSQRQLKKYLDVWSRLPNMEEVAHSMKTIRITPSGGNIS